MRSLCSPGRVQRVYNCNRVLLAAAWNVHRRVEEAGERFQRRLWPDALDLLCVPSAPLGLPFVESHISRLLSALHADMRVQVYVCASTQTCTFDTQYSRRRNDIAVASAAEGIPRHLQCKEFVSAFEHRVDACWMLYGRGRVCMLHQVGLTVKILLSMGWRLPRNMWTMRPCSCFCIESPTTSSRVLVLCKCCSTCKPSRPASGGIRGAPV